MQQSSDEPGGNSCPFESAAPPSHISNWNRNHEILVVIVDYQSDGRIALSQHPPPLRLRGSFSCRYCVVCVAGVGRPAAVARVVLPAAGEETGMGSAVAGAAQGGSQPDSGNRNDNGMATDFERWGDLYDDGD